MYIISATNYRTKETQFLKIAYRAQPTNTELTDRKREAIKYKTKDQAKRAAKHLSKFYNLDALKAERYEME